ncbi:CBS domain-containing protein [Kamptonema animale CS-326]|jgi:C4-dicarboxylate-specific signal transduction histidine kinase|uniref:CBS domain-containing protein n=1 Tax=Kamptonema animale TaxID=92934 RepID=UPI00232B5DCF|nr:CBS domain-containing protein [Kamptonema animale]MDB9512435.1 CBS domain-containing protein [Kamptonema animale CS-326]
MSQNLSDTQSLLEQAIDRNPLLMAPGIPVTEAIAAMSYSGASYTLIVEKKNLLGIFTERDVVKLTASKTPLEGVAISQVMTQNLITITVVEAGDIYSVLALFRSSKIRHLPIVDEQGYPIGVVTPDSLRQVLKPTDLLQMGRVGEIMTTAVITAPANASVFEVAQQMATNRKSCVVICQSCGYSEAIANGKPLKPIGIITEKDLVKFTATGLDIAQIPAEKLMSSPLLPVQLNTNLWHTHEMMERHEIRRLVVVDTDGYLVGIVTQSTLLYAIDPIEMYATVEILQQTIAEKTQELRTVNDKMQQEATQRQQAEEKLRQLNESLEEQIKHQTLELRQANAQLKQEICDRAEAEAEVRRLNAELEQRVQERTAQLAASNQELALVLTNLQAAQQELIHSEKMAALGQLIAGVAHEINTPLAAIRSSVQNILEFFTENLERLPRFFQELSLERQQYFFTLLQKSTQQADTLSSKQKRQLRKALQRQLESQEIAEADSLACTLADIGVGGEIEPFLPLLKAADSQTILQAAYQFATVQKSTRTIATATERAAKIVFALKSYGRYDNSGEKVSANIAEGIETVLTLYHYQIKQGVEVVRNYDPNLPYILCYPDELNQVWTNLLYNALQAMNYRGTLHIEVKQQEPSLLVSIIDTGKGIPPEIMPRIFEPFFTTKAPGEGSGLGLDIVKKIIDKHQGEIQVESWSGKTKFTVVLPLNSN